MCLVTSMYIISILSKFKKLEVSLYKSLSFSIHTKQNLGIKAQLKAAVTLPLTSNTLRQPMPTTEYEKSYFFLFHPAPLSAVSVALFAALYFWTILYMVCYHVKFSDGTSFVAVQKSHCTWQVEPRNALKNAER